MHCAAWDKQRFHSAQYIAPYILVTNLWCLKLFGRLRCANRPYELTVIKIVGAISVA